MTHTRKHRTRRKRGGQGLEPEEQAWQRVNDKQAEEDAKWKRGFEQDWSNVAFEGKDEKETSDLAAVKELFEAVDYQLARNPFLNKTVVLDKAVAARAYDLLSTLLETQKSAKTWADKFTSSGGLSTKETLDYLLILVQFGEWKDAPGGNVRRFYDKLRKALYTEKERRKTGASRRRTKRSKSKRHTRRR